MTIRNKVALVGVGHTKQGELPGVTVEELAVDAIRLALDDAGLTLADVDGLIACKSVQGLGNDVTVGGLLGINPRYSQSLDYGTCNFSLHLAVQAIVTGMADVIVMCYGANARSAKADFTGPVNFQVDLASASGLVHIAGHAALALQRHKGIYGTTDEQFGSIAVAQREWAQMNPAAIFRDPLPMDAYLAQPYLVEPLRRADVTMISDGGVALVVTSAERAADLQHPPAYVVGMAEQSGVRGEHTREYLTRPWLRDAASAIWRQTGLSASDVDVLYVQDPTAVWTLQMLEYYGFCGIGEAGPFLAERNTAPGGSLPTNTHGGQLSESYAWGWMHLVEAVRQLRGAAGPRQVSGAEIAMYCSSQAFSKAACSILSNREDA